MTRFSLAVILLFILSSCGKSPVGPEIQIRGSSTLHGTWRSTFSKTFPSDAYRKYISFDTTTGNYRELIDGGYQYYRETIGTFTSNTAQMSLQLKGQTFFHWYRFQGDTLLTSYDSLFQFPEFFVQEKQTPTTTSWLQEISWTESRQAFGIDQWVLGLAVSDSGIFVLNYPMSSTSDTSYVTRLDTALNIISITPIRRCGGIDAEGSFLWTATDSVVEKRILPGMAVVQSIELSQDAQFNEFALFGLAVSGDEIYLSGYVPSGQGNQVLGRIYHFDALGRLFGVVATDPTVKDLAFINNRLFATTGGDEFYEINKLDGTAISSYCLNKVQGSVNLEGVAYHNNGLYVADGQSSVLKIISAPIP